ncbi:MAG: NAD(P)-binding domain-containing protein, partial [Bacteroides sp.]|nr:NAD(P)-binding domain-containing protein [Bacteroides sp.]
MTSTHTITILGAGRMGAPMARRLAGAGYDVCLSARDMARLKAAAGDEPRIRITTDTAAAVAGAQLVIVAVP